MKNAKLNLDLLPTFFIIGAAKAGTTTLYDILKQYSDVYMPYQKEPSFFCDDEYYLNGLSWYLNTYYKKATKQNNRGDASPRYLFWGEKVVQRWGAIDCDFLPQIIVIFRDPVKLVYSYYWQMRREGKENLPFREALFAEEERFKQNYDQLAYRGKFTNLYSRIARYTTQLQPYLNAVPRDRFLFLLTDDLSDYNGFTTRLEEFLNLQHREWTLPVVSNKSKLPRSESLHRWLINRSTLKDIMKPFVPRELRYRLRMMAMNSNLVSFIPPPIDPDLAHQIRKMYTSEAQQLETIIGRDLSHWYKDEP